MGKSWKNIFKKGIRENVFTDRDILVNFLSWSLLQRQKRIVTYSSNNHLSNENKHFVVFETKRELGCQFSGITEKLFDVINDNPFLKL